VQAAAGKAGWSCIREPAIPTMTGLQRPEVIFHLKDRPTYLLDVTVVVDNAVLLDVHRRKILYYYMEKSVLLGTKPLVDSYAISSGTRVAYFPYVTFVSVVSFNDVTIPAFCFC